jgi:hypothetical protein
MTCHAVFGLTELHRVGKVHLDQDSWEEWTNIRSSVLELTGACLVRRDGAQPFLGTKDF